MVLPGWFDLSTNANKLRNSYLKGFLDISGGSVQVRSDNSLNFFSGEGKTPVFSIGPNTITAPADFAIQALTGRSSVKVDTTSIAYLEGLNTNVQAFINGLQNNNDTSLKVANVDATNQTLSGNLVIGNTLLVGGNAAFKQNVGIGGNLNVGGDVTIQGNQYINKALIVGGDCTIAGSIIVEGDVSMGDFHLASNTISATADLQVGGNIDAATYLNFHAANGATRVIMDAQHIVVPNMAGNATVSVDVSAISGLFGLHTNVQEFINSSTNGTGNNSYDQLTVKNQQVDGNLVIGNTLIVGGNASFKQNVGIDGNLNVGGNVTIQGDEYIEKALIVGGNATIDGSLTVKGDVSMGDFHIASNTISALHDVSFNQALKVGGALTVESDSTFEKDLVVSGHLTVASLSIGTPGDANNSKLIFNQSLHVISDVSFDSTLEVGALATLNSAAVTNNAAIGGTLAVTGASTLASATVTNALAAGSLSVTGASNFSTVTASSNAVIGGTLGVTGASTLASATVTNALAAGSLSVTGASNVSSITASSNAVIGGTLGVTGASTLASATVTNALAAGSLSVTGASNFSTLASSSNATIGGTLAVTGASTFTSATATGALKAGSLEVTGASSFSTLSASSNTTIGGTLGVTGNATFGNVALGGALAVTGDITSTAGNVSVHDVVASHDLKVGTMTLNTYNTLEGHPNSGLITAGSDYLYLQTNAGGMTVVSNDLKVEGNVTFSGTYTQIDTTIEATKMLDLSNNGTGTTLKVGQESLTQDIAHFMQGTFPVMKVLKQRQVAIGRADAAANAMLDVDGNVNLRSKLDVGQAAAFASTVTITGKLDAQVFEAHQAATFDSTATVTGKLDAQDAEFHLAATFDDAVTINTGKLDAQDAEFHKAVTFDDNIYMGVDSYDPAYAGNAFQTGFLIQF